MHTDKQYRKYLIALIAITSALRLCFINLTELGADEVYYWSFALRPQWNYFDHPPIVAWLIRLTTANLILHSEFAVRLGAVICCAIATYLCFNIGNQLKDAKTGWYASFLYSTSIYASIFIGGHILPDSPQIVFWLLSILVFFKISKRGEESAGSPFLWCMFGLTAGLAVMCKVHGIFLWFGAGIYMATARPLWFRDGYIYLGASITLIIISPIILWNFQHDFISYRFHSERVAINGVHINLLTYGRIILQQISLCNPFNFFLLCSSLVLICKAGIRNQKDEIKILLCFGLPLIIVVFFLSIFRETYPHWPGPAYTTLLFLPALRLSGLPVNTKRPIPAVFKWAFGYMIFVAVLEVFMINYFPGTTSLQKDGFKTGNTDYTLDMYGWSETAEVFDSLRKSDQYKHRMSSTAPLLISSWAPGAAVEFYIAAITGQPVAAIGNVYDLHQYNWSNNARTMLKVGEDAYYLIPSSDIHYRTLNLIKKNFRYYEQAVVIPQFRSGVLCRYIYVYRMRGYLAPAN